MAALKKTLEAIPAGGIRRLYGTAYFDGSKWWANLNGNLVDARWLNTVCPVQDGPIVVDLTDNGDGQSGALVIDGYSDQPRPDTGTILAVGVTEIVLAGADGISYTTNRFSGAYAVGDAVYLARGAQAIILGKLPSITPTPPTETPVAASPIIPTGTAKGAAGKSNTFWWPGGWGSWSGSQRGGEQVYSGNYGSGPLSGAWFYGATFTNLGGKTVTAVRFRLPKRIDVGASGSATVHLYAHTSKYQPGGDVARTVGPFDVTVTDEQPAHWIDLPLTFAPVLTAGGGISIFGDPYVGFDGRLRDPQSGRIEMDWKA
ncbi:hypothetical protein [Arthrobacter sp. ok362]|uniref:hypothetical protein n=1 Tax=Arthrobacter sp. ok362 TaxID=1761745 RepID=UPI000883C128|nr:hypothetical protein [Arthrobacter sp. ok362]SDK78939.1 hypothetical protein SAMN04487913_103188 [Arthrobacter sp. ok362]